MLPPLPRGSRIAAQTWGGDYLLKLIPSAGKRLGRWVIIGFLMFWLYGWMKGEVFALHQALKADTPAGVRIFLGVWTIGWTVGGVISILFVIALALRPSNERILIQSSKLIWTPAYPLLARFHPNKLVSPQHFLHLFRPREVTLRREEIRSISIVQVDDHDGNVTDHLVVKLQRDDYEFARDLDDEDLRWLCNVLNDWRHSP